MMMIEDAPRALERARMVVQALCLLGSEDLKEPCFEALWRQSLGCVGTELGEAHAVLSTLLGEFEQARHDAGFPQDEASAAVRPGEDG